MTIGAGIAIAGVWVFAGMMAISKTVTGWGLLMAMACAIIVTAVIV